MFRQLIAIFRQQRQYLKTNQASYICSVKYVIVIITQCDVKYISLWHVSLKLFNNYDYDYYFDDTWYRVILSLDAPNYCL
jgi:hypothetical protein